MARPFLGRIEQRGAALLPYSDITDIIINPSCNRLAIFVCHSICLLSIHPNPSVLNGKGRLREGAHSQYTPHKGIVIMLSSVYMYNMAPTSATLLIAILCFAGQLSMR